MAVEISTIFSSSHFDAEFVVGFDLLGVAHEVLLDFGVPVQVDVEVLEGLGPALGPDSVDEAHLSPRNEDLLAGVHVVLLVLAAHLPLDGHLQVVEDLAFKGLRVGGGLRLVDVVGELLPDFEGTDAHLARRQPHVVEPVSEEDLETLQDFLHLEQRELESQFPVAHGDRKGLHVLLQDPGLFDDSK